MSRNTPWRTTRSLMALHRGGPGTDWYRIKNQVSGGPTQVHIYDEIGYFGVGAMALIRDLADVQGPIDVHINSPGGEVFEGLTIYNALMQRKDVTVYIDGLCASIASVIAMAGNPVLMARQGTLMIHEGHAMAIGNAQDLRDLAEQVDRQSNNIATIYSEHTGKPVAFWRDLMKAETWMSADEAIGHGLVDRLVDSGAGRVPAAVSDSWDLSQFRNSTKLTNTRNAASHPYVGHSDHMHEPMRGLHSHNHAAFGHEDGDDGIHNHSHSHDGDASHGHGHVTHVHDHEHEGEHIHAHDAGENDWGEHGHAHTHHAGFNDHDGDEGMENKNSSAVYNRSNALLLAKYPEARFYAKDYSQDERDSMAKSGEALSDGSYPIKTCTDAHNARQAYGRSNEGDRSKVASHIRSREKALGGCGREPFQSGTDDSTDLVIDDAFMTSFQNSLRALRGV